MHSGLLILLWAFVVVVLQALSGKSLTAALLVCALGAGFLARDRCRRLLKRVRFLMLAIAIFFIGFTPGEALLSSWPGLSPSREGAVLAAEHAARLLGVVFCVAILIERLPVDRLVSGLYALLRPFELVGVPARGLAVRLLLVMHYVESETARDWKACLEDRDDGAFHVIRIERERLALRDLGIGVLGVVALVTLRFAQ
jgi:energy-coupling factor transporter transmembrane protein EcfT